MENQEPNTPQMQNLDHTSPHMETPDPGYGASCASKMVDEDVKLNEHAEKSAKKLYSQRYRRVWEHDERFRGWLQPFPGDGTKAFCRTCGTSLQAHLRSLVGHSTSRKHLDSMRTAGRRYALGGCDDGDYMDDPDRNIVVTFPSLKKSSSHEVLVVPVHPDGASSPTPSTKELIIPASVGFIGAGNMAQSLMNAFLAKGLVEPNLLMASAPSNRNLERLPTGIRTTNDNNRLVRECDIIFLCVKPQFVTEMIESLDPLERDHNPLFISVVTGYELRTLEQLLDSLVDAPRVVRTMPNTPCMIAQGCCVYTMGTNTNDSDAKVVSSMLHAVGFCAEVPEEQIAAACGLSGSGPAYIYAAIEALADGGVKMGLPRHLSQNLACYTVKGAATMVLQTGKHPGQLKDEVCSPSGTTINAMHVLEKNGFRNALMSAVEASANRSKEL